MWIILILSKLVHALNSFKEPTWKSNVQIRRFYLNFQIRSLNINLIGSCRFLKSRFWKSKIPANTSQKLSCLNFKILFSKVNSRKNLQRLQRKISICSESEMPEHKVNSVLEIQAIPPLPLFALFAADDDNFK